MKKVIVALVIVGVLVLSYFVVRPGHATTAAPRLLGKLDRGSVTEKVSAPAKLIPRDLVLVSTEVPVAKVAEIAKKAEINSPVEKNDVLLELDKTLAQQNKDRAAAAIEAANAGKTQAQAALNAAKAAQDLAEEHLNAAQKYYDTAKNETGKAQLELAKKANVKADLDVENAKAGVQYADAKYKEAETAQKAADKGYEMMSIKAPADGVIIDKKVIEGQLISPQSTPILFVIAKNLDEWQLVAQVGETDIVKVKVDDPVTFTVDAYPEAGEVFQGKVSKIDEVPFSSTTRIQLPGGGDTSASIPGPTFYRVFIDVLSAPRRFKPGLTANVDITIKHVAKALRVPTAALSFQPATLNAAIEHRLEEAARQGLKPLWLWKDGAMQLALVQTGISDRRPADTEEAKTEIIRAEGLEPGSTVTLEPGMEVVIDGPPPEKGSIFSTPKVRIF